MFSAAYYWFDFRYVKGKVDTSSGTWYGTPACGFTPLDTEMMQVRELLLIHTQVVNAVQPTIVVLPSLLYNTNQN